MQKQQHNNNIIMKWYGLTKCKILKKNLVRNYKRRLNLKVRNLAFVLNFRVNYRHLSMSIFIPTMWKVLQIKNILTPDLLIINLTSPIYFHHLIFKTSAYFQWYYDFRLHSINLKCKFFNNYYNLYWFSFFLAFNSFGQLFFNKLKFRGKGHYVYKNYRNTIAFQFGYSHIVRIHIYFLNVKFLSKILVFFWGINKFDIFKASYLFFYKRPINIFTGKGVRFTRQIMYKKTGKISSYR